MKNRRDPQVDLIPPHYVEAAFRYHIVAPLLDSTRSRDWKLAYRRQILRSPQEHPSGRQIKITPRTLRRWKRACLDAPPDETVRALCPLPRSGGRPPVIPEEAIKKAEELLAENPRRSTFFLIDEVVRTFPEFAGKLKESTLNRQLRLRHVNRRVLDDDGKPARRTFTPFEAKRPNSLWQSDVHHGPIAIVNGELVHTRIIAWIDDYSRLCCHCQAYPDETSPMLEHCLSLAVQRCGAPTCVYTDNGSIYSGVQFSLICADLRTVPFTSKPYSPWTHGKIERLWGVQEDQLWSEIALVNPMPIERLNDYLRYWVARYHRHVHSQTGQTPLERWQQGIKLHDVQLRHPTQEQIKRIFWTWARRQVSSTSMVKLHSNQYAVDPGLAGKSILVRYDPYDLETIQAWSNERRPQLHGEFTGKAPLTHRQAPAPEALPKDHGKQSEAAQHHLDELEREYERHQQQKLGLIQFPQSDKEVS